MYKCSIIIGLTLFSSCVKAEFYKCNDESGKEVFTDIPCETQGLNTLTSQGADKKSDAQVAKTAMVYAIPDKVNSVSTALEYIGLNNIVIFNLDRLESKYVESKKEWYTHKNFYGNLSNDFIGSTKHAINAQFANGVGKIRYEAKLLKPDWLQGTKPFFDVTFNDINKRMMALGLKDKSMNGIEYGYARWRWSYRVFVCDAKADFEPTSAHVSFSVICRTEQS